MSELIHLSVTSASVATPSAGQFALFLDSADGFWKKKDSSGVVTPAYDVGGGGGGGGAIDPALLITAPTLTANQDDYAPTDGSVTWQDAYIVRVDLDANNRKITGLEAPTSGNPEVKGICNINTMGNDLKFTNNDASSLAVNRLLMRDNADKSIKPNETAFFWYDTVDSRWRPYNRIG